LVGGVSVISDITVPFRGEGCNLRLWKALRWVLHALSDTACDTPITTA
jgi:hypothetical protein